jgi:ribonuclease VapC
VIDSSALVAILLEEAEAEPFMRRAVATPLCLVGAPSYLETCMVMVGRRGPTTRSDLDRLITVPAAEIVAFTESQAQAAVDALLRYGKGRQHPAGLNFGDCCSYALAAETSLPLLFKKGDFTQTDVVPALP